MVNSVRTLDYANHLLIKVHQPMFYYAINSQAIMLLFQAEKTATIYPKPMQKQEGGKNYKNQAECQTGKLRLHTQI